MLNLDSDRFYRDLWFFTLCLTYTGIPGKMSQMKIYIPNSVWLGNIDPFLQSFKISDPERLEVTFHRQWFSVHPVVLCMIVALGLNCKPENIVFNDLEAKSKHYLERMGLFKILKMKSGIKIIEHDPSGRFIPITQITNANALSVFIENMIPLLHLEPEQTKPIRYILSELARNVFEHSQSEKGAILCAQYYKKSNTVRLGIVDAGVGIKKTIDSTYSTKDDIHAIQLALTPGITGTTKRIGGTADNMGAGLFFIKSIAKVNRDFFMIYSGDAMYKLLKTPVNRAVRLYADPFRDKHSRGGGFPRWQGTVVGVDLSLDSRREFNELLSAIDVIIRKTIKEKKKQFYKRRAIFI